MISRRRLLRKLELVAPAVAKSSDRVPNVLTHYCFTGKHLIAYNDRIAVGTPLQTTLQGCVPAALFTDLLQSSRAPAAKFVAIPKPKLGLMLQRALSCHIRGRGVYPWDTDAFTKVKVHNNAIKFFTKSDRGVVVDETDVPAHPNVEEVKIRPDLLLKAYAWADKMLVTKKSVLLATDDMHTLCVIAMEQRDGA
jgi:hypothetical protein